MTYDIKLKRIIVTAILLLIVPSVVSAKKYSIADLDRQYKKASELMKESKFDKATPILREIAPQMPGSLKGAVYSDLAVCYRNTEQYQRALDTFMQALEQDLTPSARNTILFDYSNLLIDMGDYTFAIAALENIEDNKLLPRKLINTANAYFRIDHRNYEHSIRLLDSCLNLPGLDPQISTIAFQNKGYILMEIRKFADAVNVLGNAIESMPHDADYYRTLGNIALANARNDRYSVAKSQISEVEKYFKGRSDEDYRIALRKSGEIHLLSGDKEQSVKQFKNFFTKEKSDLIANISSMSKSDRLNLWIKEKPLLSRCFMLEEMDPEFLYDVALFRRLTSLLGMNDVGELKSKLSLDSKRVRKSLQPGEVAMEMISYTDTNSMEYYGAILLPKTGPAKFVKLFPVQHILNYRIPNTGTLYDAIESDEKWRKNNLYNDSLLSDYVWSNIFKAVPSSTSDLYFAPEGIFHFLGMENMVGAVDSPVNLHRLTTTSSLADRKKEIRGNNSILLIGGLDYYELPDEKEEKEERDHEAAGLLYRNYGSTEVFKYLKGARMEVDSISAIHPKADLFHTMGEERIRDKMPRFDLVHIATHGYSLNMGIYRRPEYVVDSIAIDRSLIASGLAMTGANISSKYYNREDNILSAREICDLDLSGVDFVVLSACETARGNITDEGAAGIVRGLKNAGVKTVLGTLWAINDNSTVIFMTEFYRLLEAGKSKYEAYRGAQNALRNRAEKSLRAQFSPATLSTEIIEEEIKPYDYPALWAPFILID